jgi:hypothetical protein
LLKFKVTENGQFIKLIDFSLNSERTSLIRYFKKKSKKAAFNVMVDRGLWDGMDSFITKEGLIAVGLWREIYQFAEKTGYECEIEGVERFTNREITRDSYLEYVGTLLDGIKDEHGNSIIPRDYQFEASYRASKYKFCTQELATSAGKTLIFFIYNSFLRDTGKISKQNKSLIIVPNISLVGQTAEKFVMYAQPDQQWNVCTIGGKDKFKQERFDDAEIVISTYQSLVNLNPNLFKVFSVVQVDECLHPSSLIKMADNSYKEIQYITPGENVYTINDVTGKPEINEVDFVYKNLSSGQHMYEIELENGETIRLTGNHKVKLMDGTYKRTDCLIEGDEILSIHEIFKN